MNSRRRRAGVDIQDGLIAHYKMNDNLGTTTVIDSAGTNTGTSARITSAMSAAGKIGTSLTFNGTTDKIDCGSDFIDVSPISVSAWINPTGYGENNQGNILNNVKLRFWILPTNTAIRFTSDGNLQFLEVQDVIPLSTWTLVGVTRDAAGAAIIYINGEAEGNGATGTPLSGTSNVIIGNNDAASRTFDGRIDDVRIYNKVASPAVMRAIYHGGDGTES